LAVQPAASPQTPLSTLDEVTSLSTDELAKRDVAQLNLLTAQGLPGAENLDIERIEAELDRWADHVRRETDRHLYKFRADPAAFRNSEAYFRVLMLITVLQQDLGVRYNPERVNEPDFDLPPMFVPGFMLVLSCQSRPMEAGGAQRRPAPSGRHHHHHHLTSSPPAPAADTPAMSAAGRCCSVFANARSAPLPPSAWRRSHRSRAHHAASR